MPGGGVMESGNRPWASKTFAHLDPPAQHWGPREPHIPSSLHSAFSCSSFLGCIWGGVIGGEGVSPFNHALQFGWVGTWGLQGTDTAFLHEHFTFRTFSSHWLRGWGPATVTSKRCFRPFWPAGSQSLVVTAPQPYPWPQFLLLLLFSLFILFWLIFYFYCLSFILYWSIVDQQIVLVSGVETSDSVIHIHVSIFFQILFLSRLLPNIEQSSLILCYTVLISFSNLVFSTQTSIGLWVPRFCFCLLWWSRLRHLFSS